MADTPLKSIVFPGLSDTYTIPAAGIPSSGTAGQVLEKNSSTNYDASWTTPATIRGTGSGSVMNPNSSHQNTASGSGAVAFGESNTASGNDSIAVGNENTASGASAVALGGKLTGYDGNVASEAAAVAIGASCKASAAYAIAMGYHTEVSGQIGFAAGRDHVVSATKGIALGGSHTVSGTSGAAIGNENSVSAPTAAAIGGHLSATGRACLVAGQYNEADANAEDTTHGTGARKYILIVGNGTADNARSNALTVDWSGNVVAAGKLTAGSAPTANMDVATKQYVDGITPSDIGAAPAVTEVTVSTAGAVTQSLDAGKIYHFTGAVSSLTLTLNAAGTGVIPQYHFDFDSGSTAATVSITGVTWPGGSFTPEASKHYEVDILNGYAAVMSW